MVKTIPLTPQWAYVAGKPPCVDDKGIWRCYLCSNDTNLRVPIGAHHADQDIRWLEVGFRGVLKKGLGLEL